MPGMKCHHADGQARLSAATRVLAAEAATFSAPASVEQALLRELTNVQRLRARRRVVYGVASGAIAAALAFAAWIAYRPAPQPPVVVTAPVVAHVPEHVAAAAEPAVARHRSRAVRPAPVSQEPFIAIPYTLPLEPYERADVMRMDVPVAALIAVGLPMNMADPAALARADVLVGQDGRARAIRLVTSSN